MSLWRLHVRILDLGRQAKKEEGGNPDKADTDMVPSACFSW